MSGHVTVFAGKYGVFSPGHGPFGHLRSSRQPVQRKAIIPRIPSIARSDESDLRYASYFEKSPSQNADFFVFPRLGEFSQTGWPLPRHLAPIRKPAAHRRSISASRSPLRSLRAPREPSSPFVRVWPGYVAKFATRPLANKRRKQQV